MENDLTKLIEKLANEPIIIDMTRKYQNAMILNGWILRKPKIIVHDTNHKESCSFILYQVVNANGLIEIQSFSCMTFIKSIVDQFKEQKNILCVRVVGKSKYSKYAKMSYCQVEEIKTLVELDYDMASEWKKGEQKGINQ